MNYANIQTAPQQQTFGLLLIGAPKSGKTSLALQFPGPYIADCDNNIAGPFSFLQRQSLKPEFYYDVIDLEGDKQVEPSKRWTRLTECLKKAAQEPKVQTIIVDSLTKVSDYLIDHITSSERVSNMRIQDWLSYQNLMKKLIVFLRGLPGKNLIICAHENVEKDELDGTLKYFVALPSSLKNTIGGLFTDVWRAEYQPGAGGKEGSYTIRASASARMSLGNSLGLPPTFNMDYKLIKEKMTL